MSVVAVPTPPERTLEQRFTALARAQAIRMARAELKRDIKARRKCASQILMDPPEWAKNMKVYDLLMAIPRWGDTHVRHVMRNIDIAPGKTVGGASPPQRTALLRWLHGR